MVASKSEAHLVSPVLSKHTSRFQFWLLPCLHRHWRHLCYCSNLIHIRLLNICYKPNFVAIKENSYNSCLATTVNTVGEWAISRTPIKLSLTIKPFFSRCLLPALILYLINPNQKQTLQNKYHSPYHKATGNKWRNQKYGTRKGKAVEAGLSWMLHTPESEALMFKPCKAPQNDYSEGIMLHQTINNLQIFPMASSKKNIALLKINNMKTETYIRKNKHISTSIFLEFKLTWRIL